MKHGECERFGFSLWRVIKLMFKRKKGYALYGFSASQSILNAWKQKGII